MWGRPHSLEGILPESSRRDTSVSLSFFLLHWIIVGPLLFCPYKCHAFLLILIFHCFGMKSVTFFSLPFVFSFVPSDFISRTWLVKPSSILSYLFRLFFPFLSILHYFSLSFSLFFPSNSGRGGPPIEILHKSGSHSVQRVGHCRTGEVRRPQRWILVSH